MSQTPSLADTIPPVLQACVFDWAGTLIDHGSLAPTEVFRAAFAHFGIEISEAQARGPMGRGKWDHIKDVGTLPEISAAWEARHGHPFGDADTDAVYEVFLPRQVAVAGDYSVLIPGVLDTITALRARGLKIGSTSGYVRAVMNVCQEKAAAQGYVPDCVVCADEAPAGRPAPFGLWQALGVLGVFPAWAAVKIGDTVTDIQEARNAGSWSVGLAVTGSEMGLSVEQLAALPEAERAERRARAVAKLEEAGAHYVIDGVYDLLPVIDAINERLAKGERP